MTRYGATGISDIANGNVEGSTTMKSSLYVFYIYTITELEFHSLFKKEKFKNS